MSAGPEEPAPGADSQAAPESIVRVAGRARAGTLPPRYREQIWRTALEARVGSLLAPGQSILDVGPGAQPIVPPHLRPADCRYVGLDIEAGELDRAPEGSYDERVVGDIARPAPELTGRFDLVTSYMVLEHVRPLEGAFESIRSYLRPGGSAVVQLAGGFSPFALLNRVLPKRLAVRLLARVSGRDPGTVFPAYYDSCWYGRLERLLHGRWEGLEIVPLFTGAVYFPRSPLLRALYVAYEEWALRGDHRNLAPYYLICGSRPSASSF